MSVASILNPSDNDIKVLKTCLLQSRSTSGCPLSLQLQERHGTRASKYASIFFMTGADPAEANQAAALRHLREFVALRRCVVSGSNRCWISRDCCIAAAC